MYHLCCTSTNLFFTLFCFSIVLSSTLAAETEECGLINTDQLRNKQKDVQIDEFPWMARVGYQNAKTKVIRYFCQAVLIDQQHLLSVAHCFKTLESVEPTAVLLGDWNSENNYTEEDCDSVSGKCSTPVLIDIEEIILYPIASKGTNKNDIALLRLTQKVVISDFIRPICLPGIDIKNKEYGSEQLTLTGWSRSKGHKQKKPVFIFNQHDCRRKYKDIPRVDIVDSNLCGHTCDDDQFFLSGAALMDVKDQESSNKVYLVGLESFGSAVCSSSVPDVFTRVDQYLDWIKENIV